MRFYFSGRDRLGDEPLGASPCPALLATLFSGRRSSGELAGERPGALRALYSYPAALTRLIRPRFRLCIILISLSMCHTKEVAVGLHNAINNIATGRSCISRTHFKPPPLIEQ